ncbi:MAG: DNA polymerase I [Candidatus Saccharibacteria bacterium]|nr:DNA polymerase I [Candidatus Saccharibacteria bacterium]
MAKRLVIIDGKSVFYRGYYAMPNLSTADGTPTGGVYGFAALSLELFKKLKPDYACVAWDKPKTNIRKRLEIYPDYKAGRKPAPADFYAQIPILHELLAAFGWPLYELDDYEADDILATLARKASEQGIEVCLITSDLDALQAVNPLVHVYALKKGLTNIDLFKPESFTEKYGIRVDQFLDLKALKGDSSDNIPGVPGIGEKTAVQLLQQYETLDGIYENLWQIKDATRRKLEAGKASAELSKKVAELWFDAPVPLDLKAMDVSDLDTHKLKELLTKLEFRSLLRNLPEHMRETDTSSSGTPDLAVVESAEEMPASHSRAVLLMAKELIVWPDGDGVWLSHERSKAAKLSRKVAADVVAKVPIVGHNTKAFLKDLLANGETELPEVHHDTEQGSFLLNPLRKSRELADLVGMEEIDDPKLAISAIWALYDEQSQALDALPDVAHVARTMDFPLIPVLARMEFRGIRLDSSKLSEMEVKLTKDIAEIQKTMFAMVGHEFNIASPAQLAEILYTELGLSTVGVKKGKTGYSTGQKELDKLRGQHPIIESIEQFRELTKLLNTYVKTLPEQADDAGRIHTVFRQDVAATGRLSSTDPNLQNIPIRTELGRQIRDAFVPDAGNVFVSADYSQFELRLAAVLAGDEKMINDFNAGTDIHAKTAAEVYKVPLDAVTKEQRRKAKVVNFGVLYGMSQHGLAAAANMNYQEAQHFIDEYFRVRPNIRKYIDDTVKKAHDDGFVETLFGRRRWTPDVKSSNFVVRQAAERAAANMPIQGTEADLMKMAMIRVEENLTQLAVASAHLGAQQAEKISSLPAESRVFQSAKATSRPQQLLQIHDSILIECPKDMAEKVSTMLVETMENIYPKLGVRLQVDVHTGNNWGEV